MLTKEKLDSWFEPKTDLEERTASNEKVDEDICEVCGKSDCMCYEDAVGI